MDTQTRSSLAHAIERDRQIVQAEKASSTATMEEKRDRMRIDSYHVQLVLAIGLVITVLASVIGG